MRGILGIKLLLSCKFCGREFFAAQPTQLFCCKYCKDRIRYHKRKKYFSIYNKGWRKEHSDYMKLYSQRWRGENPDYMRNYCKILKNKGVDNG